MAFWLIPESSQVKNALKVRVLRYFISEFCGFSITERSCACVKIAATNTFRIKEGRNCSAFFMFIILIVAY